MLLSGLTLRSLGLMVGFVLPFCCLLLNPSQLESPLYISLFVNSTNVRRIGYIASEITKHGGICIVANIAPYTCDREFNRKLIEQEGGA